MIKSGIAVTILFLGMMFISLPVTASAVTLVANDPATIYYTTNGSEPTTATTIDTTTTTLTESAAVSTASTASVSTFDGYYTLAPTTPTWDGTYANRLLLPGSEYTSTYGDESSVTYTLPWTFTFYGQLYNQITADTNGNIWFGSSDSAHSFNLAINGHGPVIAAWNNDLSSYLTGGVFIQHKNSPERIVIEWQTETYTDEGRRRPHTFEVVLFQDGNIRLDYSSFTQSATNNDFGSGISRDNDSQYLSITAAYGNAFTLAGNSYNFTVSSSGTSTLSLNFAGNGIGTVTSTPNGKVCSTNCYTDYTAGISVTLHAASNQYSAFTGWSGGGCTGVGDCILPMTANTLVTANFAYDTSHKVRREGSDITYYSAIQAAYNSAGDGNNIKLWFSDFDESLSFNRPVNVAIRGGYNNDYTARNGSPAIKGSMEISSGTVEVDGLQLGGSTNLSPLNIVKAGTGTGTVTGSAGGINCGPSCSASFQNGAFVTLAAVPDGNSTFTGWSGACSGTGNCPLTVNSDTIVTATFNNVVSFDVTTSAADPMAATFTIPSQGATSWLWNFGDGNTSTLQNPTHIYSTIGDYTVSLTTNNFSISKLISIMGCTNPTVRIPGDPTLFTSILSAYNAAADGSVIQIRGVEINETLTAVRDIAVTLDGGYNCDFSANSGTTIIHGAPHISAGTVKMGNIRFRQ